jgi:hypothetical protein
MNAFALCVSANGFVSSSAVPLEVSQRVGENVAGGLLDLTDALEP